MLSTVRRRLAVTVALLAALIVTGVSPTASALAAPTDPEGGTQPLREQLEAAARGFNDAQGRLDTSKARTAQLAQRMQGTETQLAQLNQEVGELAAAVYKGGRVGGFAALLDSGSPDGMLDRALTLDAKARLDDQRLRTLKQTRSELTRQQDALAAEVKLQQDQLAEMDKRKKDAEKALYAVGGGVKTSGPGGGTAGATSAPRRPDGTFGREGCSLKDPTSGGCLTPRTMHALQQAKAAGFTRFVACHRGGTFGEHPLGRACDFAAQANTFGGVAVGGDKAYGDRLAAWCIANAGRIGVLYVIWFNQIWMPSTGWRAYRSGDGTPSGNHTNHVHLSIQ